MTGMRRGYFLALLFAGLALGPSLAHLLALPNKIGMAAEDYLIVQQIYRGWALLGVVVLGQILATVWLAFAVRRRRGEFRGVTGALLCILAAQLVFWGFAWPANAATDQWYSLPADWEAVRMRWELSHAAGAMLNLGAFLLLLAAALRRPVGDSQAAERSRHSRRIDE